MSRSLLLLALLAACTTAGPDTSDTAIDDTGAEAVTWPETGFAAKLDGWDAFVTATASGDAAAVDAAWQGIAPLVADAEAATGKSWQADIDALIAVGRPRDLARAEMSARLAVGALARKRLDDAAKSFPDPTDPAAVHTALAEAHDLWPALADLVAAGDAWKGEAFGVEIEAAFEDAWRGVEANDEVAVGGAKQRIEKSFYAGVHRYVLAQAELAAEAGGTPTAEQLLAEHRAWSAYQILEDRVFDPNPEKSKNTWGHRLIEYNLSGRPDEIDVQLVWDELDEAFAKRAYAYAQVAPELLGTPSGQVRTIEGRTYYTLVSAGIGGDTAASLASWDALIAAYAANDAAAADTASAALVAELCAYQAAIGVPACTTADSPSFTNALDPATAPTATWALTDDPATVGATWKSALSALKSGISAASKDGALDAAALADAYAAYKTLEPLAEAYDPDRIEVIEAAFARMSVAIQAGSYAEAAAGKQIIEKSSYTFVQRAVLALSAEAKAGGDAAKRDLAHQAYLLIRDRVTDDNVGKAKNSLGDAIVVAMLTGEPSAIDADVIETELNVAFAKRTLNYTTHGLPESEGGAGLVGTTDGYVKCVEGNTYWNLVAEHAGATDVAAWQHWIDANRRNDLDEARWASAELEAGVCAYLTGPLGRSVCTTTDTSLE